MANVFGALNRFIARLDPESQPQGAPSTTGYGFQVLRNNDTSLLLEPWFDFIIGINGHNIDSPDPNLFATEVHNCAGTTISLGVYGARGQQIRELYVPVPKDPPSLGLGLQWNPLNAVEEVWHILDVMPNSPADVAGLLPYSDYVIGSPDDSNSLLRSDAGLGALVEQFVERALRLYVYNHEYDVTRIVTITPSKSWGGDGALGCVLGFGALHRVPAALNEPSQGPGETLFDNASPDPTGAPAQQIPNAQASPPPPSNPADFLVPANMAFRSASPSAGPPPTGRAKKARAHHATAPVVAGLDDYFKEGEQKSRELDGGSTPKPSAGLPPPPPPKGGGPPKASSPAPPTAEA